MDVEDRVLLEGSNKMTDDIHVLEPPQDLILTASLLIEVGEKQEFHLGRRLLTRNVNLHEAIEAGIPHLRQPQPVPFFAFRIRLFAGQQPEEGTLANLGETHQTEFHFLSFLSCDKTSRSIFQGKVFPVKTSHESQG
jgi:hypothetical protein